MKASLYSYVSFFSSFNREKSWRILKRECGIVRRNAYSKRWRWSHKTKDNNNLQRVLFHSEQTVDLDSILICIWTKPHTVLINRRFKKMYFEWTIKFKIFWLRYTFKKCCTFVLHNNLFPSDLTIFIFTYAYLFFNDCFRHCLVRKWMFKIPFVIVYSCGGDTTCLIRETLSTTEGSCRLIFFTRESQFSFICWFWSFHLRSILIP